MESEDKEGGDLYQAYMRDRAYEDLYATTARFVIRAVLDDLELRDKDVERPAWTDAEGTHYAAHGMDEWVEWAHDCMQPWPQPPTCFRAEVNPRIVELTRDKPWSIVSWHNKTWRSEPHLWIDSLVVGYRFHPQQDHSSLPAAADS